MRCRKDYPVVHLDTDPWELGKNYPEKVSILGDPKATLPELTAGAVDWRAPAAEAEARCEAAGACEGRGDRQPARLNANGRGAGGTASDPSAGVDAGDRPSAAGRMRW